MDEKPLPRHPHLLNRHSPFDRAQNLSQAEPRRLPRSSCRLNFNCEPLHLLPIRPEPVLILTALVYDKRHSCIRIRISANHQYIRVSVAHCVLPPSAALTQVFTSHRCSVFNVQIAHDIHSDPTRAGRIGRGTSGYGTRRRSTTELAELSLHTGFEPATTCSLGEVSVAYTTGLGGYFHTHSVGSNKRKTLENPRKGFERMPLRLSVMQHTSTHNAVSRSESNFRFRANK
jgi:hypothetical protein